MVNIQKMHKQIQRALDEVDMRLDGETALFGLTLEEVEYAARKVERESSNPIIQSMILGAALALLREKENRFVEATLRLHKASEVV